MTVTNYTITGGIQPYIKKVTNGMPMGVPPFTFTDNQIPNGFVRYSTNSMALWTAEDGKLVCHGEGYTVTNSDGPGVDHWSVCDLYTVCTDGVLTFDYTTDSEEQCDFLVLQVNPVSGYSGVFPDTDPEAVLAISGLEVSGSFSTPVTAGNNLFRFVFFKDSSWSDGTDTVTVDNINFPGSLVIPLVNETASGFGLEYNPDYSQYTIDVLDEDSSEVHKHVAIGSPITPVLLSTVPPAEGTSVDVLYDYYNRMGNWPGVKLTFNKKMSIEDINLCLQLYYNGNNCGGVSWYTNDWSIATVDPLDENSVYITVDTERGGWYIDKENRIEIWPSYNVRGFDGVPMTTPIAFNFFPAKYMNYNQYYDSNTSDMPLTMLTVTSPVANTNISSIDLSAVDYNSHMLISNPGSAQYSIPIVHSFNAGAIQAVPASGLPWPTGSYDYSLHIDINHKIVGTYSGGGGTGEVYLINPYTPSNDLVSSGNITLAPSWVDITDPSNWKTPLRPQVSWDGSGSRWVISTAGGWEWNYSMFATQTILDTVFATASMIRFTASAPSNAIGIGTVMADGSVLSYYNTYANPVVNFEFSLPYNTVNNRSLWKGIFIANSYQDFTSYITKIEMLI